MRISSIFTPANNLMAGEEVVVQTLPNEADELELQRAIEEIRELLDEDAGVN